VRHLVISLTVLMAVVALAATGFTQHL